MRRINGSFLLGCALALAAAETATAQLDVEKHSVDSGMNGAYWVSVYDVDLDDWPDLIAGSGSLGIRWYRNNKNGSFTRKDVETDFFGVWSVSAYDVDNDGDVDIFGCSTALDQVGWWENNNGSFTKHIIDDTGQDPETLFATDLDGDGDGDVIVGAWKSDQVRWWEYVGNQTFVLHIVDNDFNGVHSVWAADLNKDGRMDILGGNGGNNTAIWLNSGNGNFSRRNLGSGGAWSVFPINMDDDADLDIVRSHRQSGNIEWFRNNGGGTFSNQVFISAGPPEVWSVTAGDVDGDNDTDVSAARYGENVVKVYVNDGEENFTDVIIDATGGPRAVAAADFDRDGDDDIATALENSGDIVWYEMLGATGVDAISIIKPNGGEQLGINEDFTIQWSFSGTFSDVKIEYSVDNGETWKTVIASTPNTGSYVWSVPNDKTTQGLIKISDAADGVPLDISNSNFAIGDAPVVALTLTSPNGGESWLIGSTQPITWTSNSSIPEVKLEYSLNNGNSWTTIKSTTPNDGQFGWTLPLVESNTALVRISDPANSATFDVSDALFSIVTTPPTSLTITSPNGGETWAGSSNQLISWTSTGTIASVNLEYSLNNGISWTAIVNDTANDGSHQWLVPEANSSSALIRITDPSGGAAPDVSNATFTITGASLTLIAPNGGESWPNGSSQFITWNSTGSIATVKLEYSQNNGGSWEVIAASEANDSSYLWNIPGVQTGSALMRISDASDGSPLDISNGVFTIAPPTVFVTIVSPNGQEAWTGGSNQNITWTSTGSIPSMKIEYSLNNGGSWTTITTSTPNNGSFFWTVPDVQTSSALVRISDAGDGNPNDISNSVFNIISSSTTLIITSPDGQEIWPGDSQQIITWGSTGNIASLKLEYSLNNGADWATIISSTPNSGSFNWNVPNVSSNSALIRISEAAAGLPFDISNGVFAIVASGLTLSVPNGGENWISGSHHLIAWGTIGAIGAVKLEYSLNNGDSWTTIIASALNTGSFDWTVPNESSTNALVRVSAASDGTPADVSNAVFTIASLVSQLSLTSPNGGEVLGAGSNQLITWTTVGGVAAVKLEYSLNNGGNWTTIVSSISNTGSYNWTIPAVESNAALVRISDAGNSAIFDISNSVFSIISALTLTVVSPNGGEILTAGNNQIMTWTSSGSIAAVKLEYSLNGGGNWTTISASTNNTGSFNWALPATESSAALIRISDASNSAIFDISNGPFTIISTTSLTLTSPNGGESWFIGSHQIITWTSTSSIAAVKLEYTLDDGLNWIFIVNSTSNDGSQNWIVPATPSTSARIRISDVSNGSTLDVSNNVFAIVNDATLNLTSPNGGEAWTAGSSHFITWLSTGALTAVKLEYSLDDGGSWTTIVGSTSNDGSHNWLLPSTLSNTARVRISDANNNLIFDVSNGAFAIVGPAALKINVPNGGETIKPGESIFILWTSNSIPMVNLHFSVDNGHNWFGITNNTINQGNYLWQTPNFLSDSVLVRVTDANNSSLFDVSDGVFSISMIDAVDDRAGEVPSHFELSQNYPNPFNIETQISFAVPQTSHVMLSVYNTSGDHIRTIQFGDLAAGRYTRMWDGRNEAGQVVATGLYIYRVQIGNWQASRKMALIK